MTLTETNFKSRLLAFRDHADTPKDVKEFLTGVIDDRSQYFGEIASESARVDTYLNKAPADLKLTPMQKIVKFVARNADAIDD